MTIHQGWKRQLRRMFAEVGAPVRRLVRVRIGTLRLEDMATGDVRVADARPRSAAWAPARGTPVELPPAPPRQEGPDWAPFFTASEHREFEAAIRADLGARGWTFTQVDDGIAVDAEATGPAEYGLANLAQQCHLAGPADGPAIIHDHFDGLVAAQGASATPVRRGTWRVRCSSCGCSVPTRTCRTGS